MVKEVTEKISCDICGREGAEGHSFFYDRRMDAAGDMDDEFYDVDLCASHMRAVVVKFGHPWEHYSRSVGRSGARAYGRRVKDWIEAEMGVWKRMSVDERWLAVSIEDL